MDQVRAAWIEDETSPNVPVSKGLILSEALMLFNSVKSERGEEASEETFEATRGWFVRFREKSGL